MPPVHGNPCLVHLVDNAPETAPAPAEVIQCVSWSAGEGAAHVRCWAPTGDEIELCGHGLLCCANAWLSAGSSRESLEMNDITVRFESQQGVSWLAFPSIGVESAAVPDWARALLGAAPEQAATAGSDNGYLIVEMAADCDLAALPAPGDALIEQSTRSLIVTRRVTGDDSLQGETIQFRYFAPQFGVPEDTATGSAMRVLANYWRHRGKGNEQKALQRSAGGGWLESRIEGEHTWIGGHVTDVANATTEGAA